MHPEAVADQPDPLLAKHDAAPDGEKGAAMRCHGLYSSQIVEWRRGRDAGALAGLSAPGRPPLAVETGQPSRSASSVAVRSMLTWPR